MMVLTLSFCSCERNAKKYIFAELSDYKHRSRKPFAFAILFKTYIDPNGAPPNLALVEINTNVVFVTFFLSLIPPVKILVHLIAYITRDWL